MDVSKLVSIIVPVYNVEKYLDRCLNSLINQTYPHIEIILVDDGSKDSSSIVCDNWAKKYPSKVVTIHQKNSGASIARKIGINIAKGEYLSFVDSDDYVLPNYIFSLLESLEYSNASIAVCPFLKIRPDDKVPSTSMSSSLRTLPKEQLLKRFFKYEFWGFWGGVYHKTLFTNIIYPNATINEDYFVKAQMFSKVEYVGYCDQPLYIYEMHSGSLSNLNLSLRALDEFDNTIATLNYISEHVPEYKNHALAIASESACKWLGAINKSPEPKYDKYRQRMQKFLGKEFVKIMFNPHLLWKVKVVIVKDLLVSYLNLTKLRVIV